MKQGPLLSADEIARRLREIMATDPIDRCARRAIGIRTIAARSGLAKQYLYSLAHGIDTAGERARRVLSIALQQDRSGTN